MVRFMLVTFAFLAWAFYELSGGADFDPDRARNDIARHDPLQPVAAAETASDQDSGEEMEVTRVSLDLTSVEDVVSEGGTSRLSTRLPQKSAPQDATADSDPDAVETIPSLIQDATPENVLAAADAVDANDTISIESAGDIRVVDGSRVNVRGGPGTSYRVVDTLLQGDRVEVLDDTGSGWVRMRATESGTMGWMADFLLTDG